MKFLHAADLHLDSPLRGLERYEGAPVERIRGATRAAMRNLTRLAIDEKVDFVLIAGDVYDGDWKDFNTGLFFVQQMRMLADAKIPVVAINGNHDAANKMTRSLRLPDNVRMLRADAPETYLLPELGVAVHGQGFERAAVLEDLSAAYPKAEPSLFNIGLLHTSAEGHDGHDRYAPCSMQGLLSKGYQYWALGHVHKRQDLGTDPPVVFPGNIQGRHIRETGAKGCQLIVVRDHRIVARDFHRLEVFRWEHCGVSAADCATAEEAVDRGVAALRDLIGRSGGVPLAVRVEFSGACSASERLLAEPEKWISQLRADVASEEIWLEKITFRTHSPTALAAGDESAMAELAGIVEEAARDPALQARFADELKDLCDKLPIELKRGDEAFDPKNPAWLAELLPLATPLVVRRLLGRERSSS